MEISEAIPTPQHVIEAASALPLLKECFADRDVYTTLSMRLQLWDVSRIRQLGEEVQRFHADAYRGIDAAAAELKQRVEGMPHDIVDRITQNSKTQVDILTSFVETCVDLTLARKGGV